MGVTALSSKPLLSLCASDLMSRDVVMIPREMSVQGAARLLSRAQVSGAPVVDAAGVCVGVISSTDFVHYAETEPVAKKEGGTNLCSAWQIMEEGNYPQSSVADLMTSDPVTASPNATIGELAHMMLDAHIHRVVVVDQNEHPVGIVSATDVLAALARAEEK